MTTNNATETTAREDILAIKAELDRRFGRTTRWLDRANKLLYRDLGLVYEEAAKIEANGALRAALVQIVNELPDVFILPSWDAADKSTFENLLVLAMGYEDKESLRSVYGQALSNAQSAKVPATEIDFANWVRGKHGIANAARGTGEAAGEKEAAAKRLEAFASKFSATEAGAPEIAVELKFADKATGLSLLLVHKDSEGRTRLVDEIATSPLLASAVRAIDERKNGRPLRQSRIDRIEKTALKFLNRYILKQMRYIRGRPRSKDWLLFQKAFHELLKVPQLRNKFFDGEASFVAETGPGDQRKFEVLNPNFHELDPGRYIRGAKQWALVPYKVEEANGYSLRDFVARKQPGASVYVNSLRPKKNKAPASWPNELVDSSAPLKSKASKKRPGTEKATQVGKAS